MDVFMDIGRAGLVIMQHERSTDVTTSCEATLLTPAGLQAAPSWYLQAVPYGCLQAVPSWYLQLEPSWYLLLLKMSGNDSESHIARRNMKWKIFCKQCA